MTPNPQVNTLDEILETLEAEAFIFGNFALGKGVSTPLPDNDLELPPLEKAHKAIKALITEEYKKGYTSGVIDSSINKDRLVLEARIDELERTMPHTDGIRHYNTVVRRLAQLKGNK